MTQPIEPAHNRDVFETIKTATLLKPGDRILLVVADHWDMADVDKARETLGRRFPEVEFGFISGISAGYVIPAKPTEDAQVTTP